MFLCGRSDSDPDDRDGRVMLQYVFVFWVQL